ncbi:MAG: ribonuclease HI [Gammaproteobacteria bacterium]|nr:ribonuclease HI [Gammaproteobacteria bacterium]
MAAPSEVNQVISFDIYTDGGYFEKHDLGGWGSVIYQQDVESIRVSGWQKKTCSLEMELKASLNGLKQIEELLSKAMQTRPSLESSIACSTAQYSITLYTDSRILIEGLSQKIHLWRAKNWIHKSGNPVKFRCLWEQIEQLTLVNHVHWKWVKGHNGNRGNTLADGLARAAVINKLTSAHL